MSDDKTILDQIIAAYQIGAATRIKEAQELIMETTTSRDQTIPANLIRAGILMEEASELIEEVVRFPLAEHTEVPVIKERTNLSK